MAAEWKRLLSMAGAGLLFGLGLLLSGMANPAKVLAFLDLGGAWDPSLALVMVGAIAVAWPAFRLAERRPRGLLGEPAQWPAKTPLTRRLIGGSLLFGIGWGLAGICPGPALLLGGMLSPQGGLFLLAMAAGMGLAGRLEQRG
ncbi:DUF6691 family protein [Chromobacterium aquaticum]|uniref:DUF6691 family protein n=1 Tax=Chromobacterium aquaticum TaxID=467180 RepID=A0ABV8ZSM2_9NEIS|nr:DUF6691 family protein [Chromobacterium aquaticum]MCD5360210.1 hypothetical protein [Chromobacterium aquaticum]RBH50390.1 hypothetical protein C3F00_034960 [Pseudomonas sp. MWU13-2860]